MLEVFDVVIIGVTSIAIGLISYSTTTNKPNSNKTDLTDKQVQRKLGLAQKEVWEHAAYASAAGTTVFIFMIFAAATNMSHFPFWPRIIITIVCVIALLFIVRSITHALFRCIRNGSARKS